MKTHLARRSFQLAVLFVTLITCQTSGQGLEIKPYAWEFPVVTQIKNADDLIAELREEIQTILDSGHLAPLNCRYGDLMPSAVESHFVYLEPGRIVTTLAWAYPYLGTEQQALTRRYVARELSEDRFAPWGEYPMPKDIGARRELHPMDRVWGAEVKFGKARPSIQTVYGLWLYAYRTGDWPLIESNWKNIRDVYSRRASQGNLYGTMCAHIAVCRLADRFGDSATRDVAVKNLQMQLEAGTNFVSVEDLCRTNYYREYYTKRTANSHSLYHGAMFLNLSPEIGRYLRDHLREPVLARHDEGIETFPLWWLLQAPYFCRWTGDEGVGLSPEAIGMIAPVERWVRQADSKVLRSYTLSVPTGKGDCYWLEMLVQAIEAQGQFEWKDVR